MSGLSYMRKLSLCLIVVLLCHSLGPFAFAADTARRAVTSTPTVYEFSASVKGNAGGWGWKSLLVAASSAAASEFHASRADGRVYDLNNVFNFVKQPKFWGGLAGDLTLTYIVASLAPAIPGGIFVQTLATVAAGFVGFELGSGNIKNTDWLSIGIQSVVATGAYLGTMALVGAIGLPFAPLIATAASIGAALGAAFLLEKWRGKKYAANERPKEKEEDNKSSGILSIFSPSKAKENSVSSSPVEAKKARDEAYLNFIAASRKGDKELADMWLRRYQELK